MNAEGTYRTFTSARFDGDSGFFLVIVRIERRLHDRRGNSVTKSDERKVYSTSFSAIAAADIIGSDEAQNPILGVTCRMDNCITTSEGGGLTSLEIPFCDIATASKAKLAIELLTGAAQPDAPAARPFELHRHASATGPNLGEERQGVSVSECLRMCRANSKCLGFTVLHADAAVCQLKRALGALHTEKWSDTGVMNKKKAIK